MHRIDSATALPGGVFTEGDPMVPVPATEVSADWLNAVQEETVSVIAAAGIALDKQDNAQLLAAIVALIEHRLPPGVIPGGIMPFSGTFGGTDNRCPIPRGGTTPDTGWRLCDGGDDGAGGTTPDLRGRMILGASDAHPAGSTGGSESHTHSVAGTVGATTRTESQMPYHCHSYPYYRFDGGESNPAALANNATLIQQTNPSTYAGGSQAHSHSLTVSSGEGSSLPPYYTLAYIMKL